MSKSHSIRRARPPAVGAMQMDRFVLGACARPFGAAIGVAVLVLLLDQSLRLMNMIVEEGGPLWLVYRTLVFLLPEYFGLALPIAFLIGVLFGFRALSRDHALDVLYAGGASLRRIAAPIFTVSAVFFILSLTIVGFLQPYGEYKIMEVGHLVKNGAVGVQLKRGEFTKVDQTTTLFVQNADAQSKSFSGVFIEQCRASGESCSVITARRAALGPKIGDGKAILRLFNGRHLNVTDHELPRGSTDFDSLDYVIPFPAPGNFRPRGAHTKEMLLTELFHELQSPASANDRSEQRAYFHWIFLHSFLILTIPLFAIPLGVQAKRREGFMPIVAAFFILVSTIELLEVSRSQIAAGASPFLVMWAPFGAYLFGSSIAFGRISEAQTTKLFAMCGGRFIGPGKLWWKYFCKAFYGGSNSKRRTVMFSTICAALNIRSRMHSGSRTIASIPCSLI